jgi:acetyltransferase-like isoleucine patch superfamily enzyme
MAEVRVRAIQEVGVGRIGRYLWTSCLLTVLRLAWISPVRVALLRLFGARVGGSSVVHRITLVNVDRGGFRALSVGPECFLGDEVLIDLAGPVVLEAQVTLAARAMVLTHLNVGYHNHPLQARFPAMSAGVTVKRGTFVGAGATILAGVSLGPEAFVGAASLVNRDVAPGEVVAGVPIRTLAERPAS